MTSMKVLGDSNPLLVVDLDQNETLYARPDALIQSDENVQLKGRSNGGFFRSIVRNIAHGQAFFQQQIVAKQPATFVLGADVHEGIEVIDITPNEPYLMSDGAFLASTHGVECATVTQGILSSLFGNTGGFLIMEARGSGQLAVSSFGSLAYVDVEPDKYTYIDNGHVVAWSKNLEYGMSIHNKGSGLAGSVWNSFFSREGMMMQFKGRGRVYFSSKKPSQLLGFIASSVRPTQN